jgi:spore coat polysaccharide biosynthesis protein SpsF
MKIGAIVQARTSSTRLPGKVLKDLPYGSGITVLQQVMRRLKKAAKLDDVIVATTTDEADEEVVKLADKENIRWFRGSTDDVLARYYAAAKESDLDIVVRVTSDCPCIDPEIVDWVLEKHLTAKADFTATSLHRTFPRGLDIEVLSFDALKKAHFGATEAFEREHVCPYIYKSKPHMFKICEVRASEKLYGPNIRITLDTEEDYTLLCAVFDYLYPENKFFGTEDIIKLFRDRPWLGNINKNVVQKGIFDSVGQEIEEAVRLLDLQGLGRAGEILARHMQ